MIPKKLLVLIGLFFVGLLLVMAPSVRAAPVADEATPTPAAADPAVITTTIPTTATTMATVEPTMAELRAHLDALQTQVDELEEHLATDHEADHEADATQVGTAVYLLDTADLHGLDVQLNEEKVINSSDAGRIARLVRLLSSVVWPEALATDAHALIDLLAQLATALTDDNLEAAAPLATQVHEAQHDFSHAVEHWLGEAAVPSSTAGQAFRVTSAVYLLDNAGFHDLDDRLNGEKVIDPADAGHVARVVRLLSTVDWPDALATDAVTLTTALTDLATALADDNLEVAALLATQVHDVQHDFSHAAEHWLNETLGTHAEGADTHSTAGDDHAATEDDDHEQQDAKKDSSGG